MTRKQHPLAGKTVKITSGQYSGEDYRIEDWQKRVYQGQSWMDAQGNPAAIKYAIRSAVDNLPIDDNVLYGKIGSFGEMIHISEIGE